MSKTRVFDLPVVIARMNASYGPNGGLPAYHLDWIVAGEPVTTRWDPCPYSPIHQDDINAQAEMLLGAASVPATIVNWGGDEAVSPQEWCAYFGELTGREATVVVKEMPGTTRGSIMDATKRQSITGPCAVSWRDGMRRTYEARYPDGVDGVTGVSGQASNLLSAYRDATE
jgi:nucleoside-diphosphate-sugar epimerase